MSNSQRALQVRDMPASEQAQHQDVQDSRLATDRIVSNDDVEKALRFLRDNAKDIGDARGRMIKAGHMIKHVEAILFLASQEKSAEARKMDARTDARWLEAANEEALAAADYEKLKSLREAAALRIEVFRTESSNLRAIR